MIVYFTNKLIAVCSVGIPVSGSCWVPACRHTGIPFVRRLCVFASASFGRSVSLLSASQPFSLLFMSIRLSTCLSDCLPVYLLLICCLSIILGPLMFVKDAFPTSDLYNCTFKNKLCKHTQFVVALLCWLQLLLCKGNAMLFSIAS